MYRSRYTGSLSYVENTLYFLIPKEKVEEIRERIVKKLIEVNRSLSNLFFLLIFLWGLPAPPRAPRLGRRAPPVM
jgi:hypothetical protein